MLNVDCITDFLIKLNRVSIQKFSQGFLSLKLFIEKNLERTFVRLNKRIVNHLQSNLSRDRYLNFLTEYPEIETVPYELS